ncbi:MAG: hypothetical protein AAF744_03210 [Pseudomonadota bacterium]
MHEELRMTLPSALVCDARMLAEAQGFTLEALIKQHLYKLTMSYAHPSAPATKPLKEQQLEKDDAAVGLVFSAASDWADLDHRVAQLGYELRPAGNGLALYRRADDRFHCNTARFGCRYRVLVRRFGGHRPGHPLACGRRASEDVLEDDFDVIERF